ncbi:MAG: PfkB family carbohydrate kinase [Tissierellia bacterium]|nr:PfkB family carbohydrate kinase [Tissierellia bacterium]
MSADILISGYVSLDRIVKIDKEPQVGKTSIVQNKTNSDIFFGGCSVNISVILAKLGVSVMPTLRVGSDYTSTGFRAYLENANVNTSGIRILDEDRTSNCYLLESEDGNHITLFYPGAQDPKHFSPLCDEMFNGAKLAVLTVGAEPDNAEFLYRCKCNHVPLVFGMKTDTEAFPKALLTEVLQYAEIVFMNESEETDIIETLELDSITDLFKIGNANILVVTKGNVGSTFWQKTTEGITSGDVGIVKAKRVLDTTGSGDAYMSGFLYGYLNQFSVADSCLLGSTTASFVIEEMGCTTNAPTLEALLNRYKETKSE